MIEAFEHYFGEYPFKKDGYKLIEVPYSGMEHQSAVTYGNRFANGYLERDWTGVGVSLKFDFIIIHESGHEWFGNAVSRADVSDMWIHEGWTHVSRVLYVEHLFGATTRSSTSTATSPRSQPRADHHAARHPSHAEPGHVLQGRALPAHAAPTSVNDDARWWKLLRDRSTTSSTRTSCRRPGPFFNAELAGHDADLRSVPAADALPVLELTFDEAAKTMAYRWKADDAPSRCRSSRRSAKWQIDSSRRPTGSRWRGLPGRMRSRWRRICLT
jgi:hypothetical protein